MNSLIEVTQTGLFTPVRLLAQVEYNTQAEPPSAVSMLFGLLIALLLIVLTGFLTPIALRVIAP